MKKIEMLALFGVIIVAISLLGQLYLDNIWITKILRPEKIYFIRKLSNVLPTILLNSAIAIWMFIESRRNNNSPYIWVLFALWFGLTAPILFYIMQIYTRINNKEINSKKA
jgi:hypothetical protein